MDIELIEDTIAELEQDATSFDNCEKLAYLYICRDNYYKRTTGMINSDTNPQKELEDLLPAYNKYVDTKTRYQKYEVVEQMLIYSMDRLCEEIVEFISSLYHNTETEAERALLIKLVDDIRSAI